MKSPQFCFIAPTAYLSTYAQSTTHLVLAHLVDTNKEYADFYARASYDLGHTIIMDNGAFELGQSYDPNKLVDLGVQCGAHYIVLPDYPFQDSIKTIQAACDWTHIMKGNNFKTMFVPQSKTGNLEDWIQAYQWAAQYEEIDAIGMSILGIPNALPHIPKSYARVVMTQLLQSRGIFNTTKYHHYLGLNSAPNVEIPSLILMDALDSCDSSNPIWSALNGYRYNITSDSFLPISKKYLREVDFDYEFVNKTHIHEAIQYNIDTTIDIFKNPHKYL